MSARVAVVGAGWSGLAAATLLGDQGHEVDVFEADDRPGGRIRTTREAGYLVEAGPHGIVPASEASQRLLDVAGVEMLAAPPRAPRFVVRDGTARALPASPPALLATPLLSPSAKLRLLREPFVEPGPRGETVAAFGRRRLGDGVADLLDAFVTGVYAGDPERLVLEHAFPSLARMDAHGGLLRNAGKGRRAALAAPREGMEAVVRALAAKLRVSYGARVERVERAGDGVRVTTGGERLAYDRAVLATDPPATARILGIDVTPPPMAPVHVVAFAMPENAGPPHGYGVLAPERAGLFVLGALYESRLFTGRAPAGEHLVRCLVGGRRHPERARLPHEEIARRAWADLVGLGVVRGEPTRAIHLETTGIPQPEAAHETWLASLPTAPIHVLGIGQAGVGLDALAEAAARVARVIG